MCNRCVALRSEVARLERHAAELIEDLGYFEDFIRRDAGLFAQLLADVAGRRFATFVPSVSELDEKLVH